MNPEYSLSAFEERKETIFKWAIEECNGKKLVKALFSVPMEKRKIILDFLNKNKICCL